MTRYPLARYQAQAALEGQLSRVMVPLKEQPHSKRHNLNFNKVEIVGELIHFIADPTRNLPGNIYTVVQTFPEPGNTFAGLEAMCWIGDNTIEDGFYGRELVYDVDLSPVINYEKAPNMMRIPAQNMATASSRITLTVIRRGVQRLGDMTEVEVLATGCRTMSMFRVLNGINLPAYNPDLWQFYAEVSVAVTP